MKKLRLREFVARSDFFHVGVTDFRPAQRDPVIHTHDFDEVFLVTAGRGVHWINGRREQMTAGDLCMIRSRDGHGFRAIDSAGFSLVNIAFASETTAYVQRRYFPRAADRPWGAGAMPRVFRLAPQQMSRLNGWVGELSMVKQTRMELDRFLLNLCSLTHTQAPGAAAGLASSLPDWLADAVERFGSPEHMAGGPMELARLSGRCPEHVNRVVRRCMKRTTTDLVNEVRLLYAGRQLRMTQRPILDIVSDCGLENLAYFYRLFRKRYGLTPRRFRLRGEAVVR